MLINDPILISDDLSRLSASLAFMLKSHVAYADDVHIHLLIENKSNPVQFNPVLQDALSPN